MGTERLNHTVEGKLLVFTDHIMYEFKMLRMTYALLGMPWYSGWVGNALLESFCIHARALVEFFEGTSSESGEDVCAFHFTEAGYRPFSGGKVKGRLWGKLNAQIAHLSYQRTKEDDDKIGADDRRELLEVLNKEIDNFAANLKTPYREHWPEEMKRGVRLAGLAPQNNTALVTGLTQPFTLTPKTMMSD